MKDRQKFEQKAPTPTISTAAAIVEVPAGVNIVTEVQAPAVNEIEVRVPLAELGPGHVARHVEFNLDLQERTNLARVRIALEHRRAKLRNGKPAYTTVDALRWILQQMESVVSE